MATVYEWRTEVIFGHTPQLRRQELKALRLALVREFGESAKLRVRGKTRTEIVLAVEVLLEHYSGYQAVGAMWERIDPVLRQAIGTYDPVNHGAEPKDGDWGPWMREHG